MDIRLATSCPRYSVGPKNHPWYVGLNQTALPTEEFQLVCPFTPPNFWYMPWIPPLLEIAFTVWQSQPKNTIKQAAEVSWVDHSIHIILSDSIWSYLILSDPLSDPIGSKCKTQVFKDIASFGLALALTGFFWLLSHVIYLKLTKVLK